MNKVLLIGNIVRDLELRKTTDGKSVLNFTIAFNDYNGNANYFDCVSWGKTADFMSQYVFKGNKVAIDGRLQQRTYEKNDGTKANIIEVVVEQVDLLTPKETTQKESIQKENVKNVFKNTPFETGPLLDVQDSDLPF